MATRSIVPLEDLREMLASVTATYAASLKTDLTQYSVQDRTFLKEQRRFMRAEMDRISRKIGLADPEVNALGSNKVDFMDFRYRDST